MVGIGMTLTGACPGTIFVQVGRGVPSGRTAIIGGIMGGILYALLAKHLRRAVPSPVPQANSLPAKFGMNPNVALVIFDGMCISMILAARYIIPSQSKTFLDPVVGGGLIGAAQLAALLLTGSPVGVSTCYEDIGRWFWGCLGYKIDSSATPGAKSLIPVSKAIAFASGILVSSYTIWRTIPGMIMENAVSISPMRSILGGLIMVFGARIAGGCTSGHGITGMSMLSMSSIITVASMFAGGIGLAQVM